MLCTIRLARKHTHTHTGPHSSTFEPATTTKIVFTSKVRPCTLVALFRYHSLCRSCDNVHIMMFVYPCVDILHASS